MDIVKAEEAFIQKMQSKNWSKSTIGNYACQVRIFLREFQSKPRAKEISANEIEQYLLTKVKINTRNHARCGINAFYKLLINQPEKIKVYTISQKRTNIS